MWTRNYIFIFQNQCYGGLKKLVFRLFELLLNLEQSFRPFLKVKEEKLKPHSQISFENWVYNEDSEHICFLSK